MAGTAWPSLVAGAKAKASEVESKFDWSEQDITPHNAGTKTDATYDLGTSSFRFRDLHLSRQIFAGNGTVSAPSYSFGSDGNSGIFRIGADNFGFTTNGIKRMDFTTIMNMNTNIAMGTFDIQNANNVRIGNGTAANPTLAFESDQNLGFFRVAADQIGISANGSLAVTFGVSGGVNGILAQDGTTARPGYSFSADVNSGMARLGTDHIILVTAGVEALDIDSAGIITQPLQSSFAAKNSVVDSDATGDNTAVTVEFNTEIYDQNSDYNNATDIFTAPVTGRYLLIASVDFKDAQNTNHSSLELKLTTSNRNWTKDVEDEWFPATVGGQNTLMISVIADMDAADTCTVTFTVFGASKVVDINGGDGTFFSGSLIN